MKTIAIIGTGPGLGFSLAKTFGRHGFRIAMVSRTQQKLDQYAEELRNLGIEAKGFAADITNKDQLSKAFQQMESTYGTIDVVEYSPPQWKCFSDIRSRHDRGKRPSDF